MEAVAGFALLPLTPIAALLAAARSQINLAPGDEDAPDLLVVTHAKSNNGRPFPPFAVRLNDETMTYAPEVGFDLAKWRTEVSGRPARIAPATVSRVIEALGGKAKKPNLVAALVADTGRQKTAVYDAIKKAARGGWIEERNGEWLAVKSD